MIPTSITFSQVFHNQHPSCYPTCAKSTLWLNTLNSASANSVATSSSCITFPFITNIYTWSSPPLLAMIVVFSFLKSMIRPPTLIFMGQSCNDSTLCNCYLCWWSQMLLRDNDNSFRLGQPSLPCINGSILNSGYSWSDFPCLDSWPYIQWFWHSKSLPMIWWHYQPMCQNYIFYWKFL